MEPQAATPQPNPPTPPPQHSTEASSSPKYSLQVQAASLFDFLRQTFGQMPRTVQIIGWLVFLMLFAFLVLYPLLGITYIQGKIVPLSEEKNPKSLVKGLRVSKGLTTFTNDDGDFTLALRVPNLGLLWIDLDVGDELVPIPGPLPFVPLFNPNASKIYFVPGSMTRSKLGVPQHYFLDAEEAARAYKQIRESTSRHQQVGSIAHPERPALLAFVAKADAMEQRYDVPTYTLRIQELQLNAGDSINEVYFEIRVDGRLVSVEGLPNATSRTVDRVTIVRGEPVTFSELGIPLNHPNASVQLDLFTAGFFTARKLASISVDIGKWQVGAPFRVAGTNASGAFELLPPMAIGTIGVAVATGPSLTGTWLQVPDKFSALIGTVRWLVGDTDVPGSPDRYYYRGGLSTGTTVKAKVAMRTGSVLTLASQARGEVREPRTPEELYAVIDILRREGNSERALALAERAAREKNSQRWAFQVQGAVLRETGRFSDAMTAYGEALKLEPESATTLVGYALTLVDWPESSPQALLDAKRSVERAIKIEPTFVNGLVAQGGVAVRLQNFNGALEILTRAREMEQREGLTRSPSLQRNHYYAALAYLGLQRVKEAKTELADVLAYAEKWGYRSIASRQLVELARRDLGKL